jgi:hypothetical protein
MQAYTEPDQPIFPRFLEPPCGFSFDKNYEKVILCGAMQIVRIQVIPLRR